MAGRPKKTALTSDAGAVCSPVSMPDTTEIELVDGSPVPEAQGGGNAGVRARKAKMLAYQCKALCFSGGKLWREGEVRISATPLPEALWQQM